MADLTIGGATRPSTATLYAERSVTGAFRGSTAVTFVGQVAALYVTQLLVETLDVVPASPLTVSQVVAEYFFANANEARVTLLACELIIIPYLKRYVCPLEFPID